MLTTLVSVYIPTKNRLPLLRRAITSVLAQTVRNIELIVVSDGCDDGTCEYVRSIDSDIRVRLIHNETSVGACRARNQALEISHGHFVTGLDDDDFFMPSRIENFLSAWENLASKNTKFSCLFDSRIVDEGPRVYVANTAAQITAEQIISSNDIGNQIFTTRERAVNAGMYDVNMPAWQDWEFWVRLLREFGPAISIQAKSYYMDVSHEFDRITLKSPDKIVRTAQLFYAKHCTPRHLPAILTSLDGYAQVRLSLSDLFQLAMDRRVKLVLQKLRAGKYSMSLTSSIPPAPLSVTHE
jgi:glycosyltransferase involved in cell wall biosynthesis